MKRFCLTVFILIGAVFSVYSQTGVIRELTGEVEIKPAGSANFIPAQVGALISADTIVSTGFRSIALITAGSAEITVRPLTRLSFAEINRSAETENLNVNLQAGRIRVDVKPPAGARANTTVRTPSATASVRGTSFEIDARNLNVTNGTVNWRDSTGFSASVTAGYSSSIGIEGIVDPIEIAEAEFAPALPVGTKDAGDKTGTSIETSGTGDVGIDITW